MLKDQALFTVLQKALTLCHLGSFFSVFNFGLYQLIIINAHNLLLFVWLMCVPHSPWEHTDLQLFVHGTKYNIIKSTFNLILI